jgi:phosphoglycolate phosphatase
LTAPEAGPAAAAVASPAAPAAVLFDLDGTLVDSFRGIAATFDAVLVRHGHPRCDHARLRTMIGAPLERLFALLLPVAGDISEGRPPSSPPSPSSSARDVSAYVEDYLELYPQLGVPAAPLFPGVRDLLLACRRAGLRLAVVTSKRTRVARAVLESCRIAADFEVLIGADSAPLPKPDAAPALAALSRLGLAPAAAIVVGDTVFDVQMARAAGCRAVGVAWGYQEGAALLAAGAMAVAPDPARLTALLTGATGAE